MSYDGIMKNISLFLHLRAWRKTKGFSVENVANALGTTQTTIGRWEVNKSPISYESFKEIAKLYGISVLQLMLPPDESEKVEILEEAYKIIKGLDESLIKLWLDLGYALIRKEENKE